MGARPALAYCQAGAGVSCSWKKKPPRRPGRKNAMLDIDRLITALDLADLVRQAGGKLNGKRTSCACPLHGGDNPAAFHIWTSEDGHSMWTCYTRCGSGNALTFL